MFIDWLQRLLYAYRYACVCVCYFQTNEKIKYGFHFFQRCTLNCYWCTFLDTFFITFSTNLVLFSQSRKHYHHITFHDCFFLQCMHWADSVSFRWSIMCLHRNILFYAKFFIMCILFYFIFKHFFLLSFSCNYSHLDFNVAMQNILDLKT